MSALEIVAVSILGLSGLGFARVIAGHLAWEMNEQKQFYS